MEGLDAEGASDLDQPVGVRAVPSSDDDHRPDLRGEHSHFFLPLRRGVAYRVEHSDVPARFLEQIYDPAEELPVLRALRHHADLLAGSLVNVGFGLDDDSFAFGIAHKAFYFRVSLVADYDNAIAVGGVALDYPLDSHDERAGGIEVFQPESIILCFSCGVTP